MPQWVPFKYRDFWDVPRMIVLEHNQIWYLLLCVFDEQTEDYADTYSVFVVEPVTARALDSRHGSWMHILSQSQSPLGSIPLNAVTFDDTRRQMLDASVLANLA